MRAGPSPRDSIRGECVENDEPVVPVRCASQREPCVSKNHVNVVRTLLKEREITRVTGNPHDGRIDLEECKLLPPPAVAGEGPSPKSDDGHSGEESRILDRREQLTDRARTMEVGERLLSPRGIGALYSVVSGAVDEHGQALGRIDANLRDSEEAAFPVHGVVARSDKHDHARHQGSYSETECEGPISHGEAEQSRESDDG